MVRTQYVEAVTKMIENHGYLNASSIVRDFAPYVSRAHEEGMTAVRCANNICKKVEASR